MSELQTVFVVGASGYTGQAVVAQCRKQGWHTVAHIRPGSSSLARLQPGFEASGAIVDTTEWDADAFAATLERVRPTIVFSLLGITRSGAKREAAATGGAAPTYREVDYRLTMLAAHAAASVSPQPRFVFLSSLGADAPGGNAYLRARFDVERDLATLGAPFTVARPSFITGDDRDESRPAERIGAAVADVGLGLLGALGAKKMKAKYRSRTADELAASLVRLAADPRASNKAYQAHQL
ncbi:MAG: hypothetical protein ACI81R_003771 [Bradymonadia bacterium]|jgi:uncharacterized protein YbjT (DUF2867 family)